MSIKAVIFDFGNVISMPQTYGCFDEMEKRADVPKEVFRGAFCEIRNKFDLGEISARELYAEVLNTSGYSELSQDTALCEELGSIDLASWRSLNCEVCDWALELQKGGFKLGVLSNMPREFLARYKNENPVFCAADFSVFSCDVRIIKPDPRIYQIALDGLGVLPHEAVFFDDLERNITAAQNLSIHGILWQNLTQAKADFAALVAKNA